MKQPIKMTPGDELHLTALMAPFSLNLVTGQDRQHLLGYGRAAFEAGKAGQCLHQIQEPAPVQAVQTAPQIKLSAAVRGVGVVDDCDTALAVYFTAVPRKEDIRALHDALTKAPSPQAAPAAVAVPDESATFEKWWGSTLSLWGLGPKSLALEAWQARAALAATPAAAVPVVQPEPAGPIIENLLALARIVDIAVEDWGESLADGSMDVKFHSDVVTELESILDHFDGLPEGPDDNVIESGPVKAARILRALLATATGLPAQAAEQVPVLYVSKGQLANHREPTPSTDSPIIASQEELNAAMDALYRSRIGLQCPHCKKGTYRADGNGYYDFHRCDSCRHVPMWGSDGKEFGIKEKPNAPSI